MPKTSNIGTVTLNAALNGVEIRFEAKPGETIRERLKGDRWRWSSTNRCWYKTDSLQAREFAYAITGTQPSDLPPVNDEQWVSDFTDIDGRLGA